MCYLCLKHVIATIIGLTVVITKQKSYNVSLYYGNSSDFMLEKITTVKDKSLVGF